MFVSCELAFKHARVFAQDPGKPSCKISRVVYLGRYAIDRIDIHAHSKFSAHMVEYGSPFRFKRHDLLLLPFGAGRKLGPFYDLEKYQSHDHERKRKAHDK
jgi:hypothetical protein